MALPVSRLVRVTVNLAPLAAARRSFGILCIAGDSNVISPAQRIRSYSTIEEVADDFGTTAPEYLAAALYFGQSPKPSALNIGRWVRTASAAFNQGAILSASEQLLTNFSNISAGTLSVTIDSSAQNLTGLDFTSVTNLNGVATVIQTALSSGATCTWDGSRFKIVSGTTGEGVAASGTIAFGGNPVGTNTLVINGKTLTYVAAAPGANEILIGGDAEATAANTAAYLTASTDPLLTPATYVRTGTDILMTWNTIGTAGNAITLSETGTAITVPATLSGGAVASSVGYTTGTVSALLKTQSGSGLLVAGYAAETPVECATELADFSTAWYGLMFAASVLPTVDQNIAVSALIEGLDIKRIYGVTITDTTVLDSEVTNDLASQLKELGYKRSFTQYSSDNEYAIASFIGRAFSVNFNANRTTITLMYKQEPGVAGEDLTTSQANTLQDKRCNVFVDYVNDTQIIQYGTMAGSAWFDEIQGLDWLENSIQTDCYNLLYTSTTKIPQTDAGINQFVSVIGQVCDQAVNNGLVAPGTWTQAGFGQLTQGQYLKSGYYIYAQPLALQSTADRAARIAPPIQVAVKLAGAIQELDVIVDVNR